MAAAPPITRKPRSSTPGSGWTTRPSRPRPSPAAVVALTADRARDKAQKRALIKAAIPVLRNWSTQAAGITVTAGNTVAVLQGVVDNLETFYSRFADLLEVERYDK